jgi:hypothetical protein
VQGGPGAGVFPARRAPDAALINDRQGKKCTFDCPSDSFEIGVRLVAVKSFSRQD